MLNSDYRQLCAVALPYAGRQKYMHTFDLALPVMAPGFEDYLLPVIALCWRAGATEGLAHMTVDEKIVAAGMSQRRPHPHVDGCFMPAAATWGHPNPGPGWAHECNNIPLEDFRRMSVIVAASVPGCRVWRGQFDGVPASDGDLSQLALGKGEIHNSACGRSDITRDLFRARRNLSQLALGKGEILSANVGYLLSPDCVHESVIQQQSIQRTFLRIALPVEYRF